MDHATIIALLGEAVEAAGFEVIRTRMNKAGVVRAWVDRDPGGVNVNDCVELVRAVEAHLEHNEIDPGDYQIEIQSPGVDRPLEREKDFVRFASHQVHVRLREKRIEVNRKNFKGKLVGLVEGEVVVEGDETWHFRREEIDEVRLDPALELPQEARQRGAKKKRGRKPTKSRRKRPKEH